MTKDLYPGYMEGRGSLLRKIQEFIMMKGL